MPKSEEYSSSIEYQLIGQGRTPIKTQEILTQINNFTALYDSPIDALRQVDLFMEEYLIFNPNEKQEEVVRWEKFVRKIQKNNPKNKGRLSSRYVGSTLSDYFLPKPLKRSTNTGTASPAPEREPASPVFENAVRALEDRL